MDKLFADIILPLAVPTCYTYSTPETMLPTLKVGMLVNVPLGKSRHYNGIVLKIHSDCKEGINYKPIEKIVLPQPILTENQIRLWQWIAEYYMCKLGDVLKAAIPTALFKAEYKARTETFLRLAATDWTPLFDKRKPTVQQHSLLNWLKDFPDGISLAEAQERSSVAVINLLEKKGIVEKFSKERSRFCYGGELQPSSKLSPAQQKAFDGIKVCFEADSKPVLLHGITSSGKTEIYIKLIEKAVAEGHQVLYLVPEIALTTQLTKRLQKFFGDKMLVYHSKLNDQERAEVYKDVLADERYKIVLGVRSAVFLPFRNLGLVIIDEQHDSSYKQQEPAPRYNAVNCAIMLAKEYNAKVVMGSATPSVEGYYNALTGKWHLVELKQRFKEIEPPSIEVVDMRVERGKRKVQSMFSWILRDKIIEAVNAGEQVILFHNRRGYASLVECEKCGWVPKCDKCSVSLTYHKQRETLECHYCGHKTPMPAVCPVCGEKLSTIGYGTEQVESALKEFLPDAKVLRLDLDTTKGKNSYKSILDKFSRREADILLGTQMVSKGLDFEGVSLVGVINADTMLDYPDFRSSEVGFQTLLQVAGRSGRSRKQGVVVLQTSHAEYPIIEQIVNSNYIAFYNEQISIRSLFSYPPFCRVMFILMRSRNKNAVLRAASEIAGSLLAVLPGAVLGPEAPPVGKIQNYYCQRVLVKVSPAYSLVSVKKSISHTIDVVRHNYGGVEITVDVDPI